MYIYINIYIYIYIYIMSFRPFKSQRFKETVSVLQIQYSGPLILKIYKNMKKYR